MVVWAPLPQNLHGDLDQFDRAQAGFYLFASAVPMIICAIFGLIGVLRPHSGYLYQLAILKVLALLVVFISALFQLFSFLIASILFGLHFLELLLIIFLIVEIKKANRN